MLNGSPGLAGCPCRPTFGPAGPPRGGGPRASTVGGGVAPARAFPGVPGGAVLADQVTGPPAERHEVARPDPPPRAGQQPDHRAGRGRVVQHPQSRDDVGHLGDVEQPAEPDHLDRDPARLDGGAQHRELGPLAAEHGDVGRADAGAVVLGPGVPVRGRARRQVQQPLDPCRDPGRLVRRGVQQGADHPPPPGPPRGRDQPRHLRRLGAQPLLQGGGGVQHAPGVAEAGGQRQTGPAGRRACPGRSRSRWPPGSRRRTGQVARAGAAPAVDRLAGIADRGDRMAAAEQSLQQHPLGDVGVLVLVEQHDLVAGARSRTAG